VADLAHTRHGPAHWAESRGLLWFVGTSPSPLLPPRGCSSHALLPFPSPGHHVFRLGTRPGHRLALCVERPLEETHFHASTERYETRPAVLPMSDSHLLTDVWGAVNRCVAQLRRKEIYSVMRARALDKFQTFLGSAVDQEGFDGSQVDSWIFDAIQTCCPGIRLYTASVVPDGKSLKYTLFDPTGRTRTFTLFPGQGSEWEFAGRHPPRCQVVKRSHDFAVKHHNAYVPFANAQFPRFIAPFAAGDVSLGFFGVEKFDVYR